MRYSKINAILKSWGYDKKSLSFNACNPVERPDQQTMLFDQAHSGTEPDGQTLALSSRRPWVKAGSVLALTGYVGQMACQFLACSLWTGGLWLANPARAMETGRL